MYVPYYDPLVVYGTWWWPAYQPVYWAPWPGYYVRPGYAGFAWGTSIGVSIGFFFGDFDWHDHHARVVTVNNFYYSNQTVIVNRQDNRTNINVARNVNAAPGVWRHDPAHRRGAPYRVTALREKFGGAAGGDRREFREREPAAPPAAGANQNARPETRGSRPESSANAGRVDPRLNPPPARSGDKQQHRAPAPPPQANAPVPRQPAPARPTNPPAQHAASKGENGKGAHHDGNPPAQHAAGKGEDGKGAHHDGNPPENK